MKVFAGCLSMFILSIPFYAEAGAAEEMKSIIEAVKSNERNYRDLRISIKTDYRLVNPAIALDGMLRERNQAIDCIIKNNQYYLKEDTTEIPVAGQELIIDTTTISDGKNTRYVQGNVIANIRYNESKAIHDRYNPFLVLFQSLMVNVPFSTLLGGDATLKGLPDAGRYSKGVPLKVEYVRDEAVDGEACKLVRLLSYRKASDPDIMKVWLSPSHNYLPVKMEGFNPDISAERPVEVGMVKKWRKVDPGVWFPAECESTIYLDPPTSPRDLQGFGKYSHTLGSVELHPVVEEGKFSDLPIPLGTTVIETDGGKILRQYKQGEIQ
ncbi:hypothetical protein TA3x_001778 [Tundrisphaera sp. TA3]|uniref:hypothetical protein n=1 Tax=Tundrisphaera sp. TA3 TaxID=3435775 RepID=UPI003EB9D27E